MPPVQIEHWLRATNSDEHKGNMSSGTKFSIFFASVCFVILIVGFRVVAHWGNRERARKTRITARRPRTALELERAASRASVDSAETLVERSPGHFVTLPQPPPQAHVQQR